MNCFSDLLEYLYENLSDVRGILSILLIFTVSSLIYSFFLIIIHEAGHFVFGKVTGYQFISFRIFKFTFVHENNRIVIKKYSFPGSIGQCIMSPPEYRADRHPFVLYNMGGVIFNTLMLIIFILMFLSPLPFTKPVSLIIFACLNIEFCNFLINAIPRSNGIINNDSTNLFYLLKDEQAVKSFYAYLKIVKELLSEKTYKDYPETLLHVPESADLSNEIITLHKLNECYFLMDLGHWKDALSCIEVMEQATMKRSRLIKDILLTEKLFLYIKLNKSSYDIEALYHKVQKQLYHCGMEFNFIRTRMVYEFIKCIKSMDEINQELEMINKVYPYRGEAVFNNRLVRLTINKKEY